MQNYEIEIIDNMSALDLFNNGTMEMYHGGIYPDENTFMGKCWLKLYNQSNKPGERIIDWQLMGEDIKEILEALDHYKSDKNHKYYKFLQEKLREAYIYDNAGVDDFNNYSDLELTILSFIPKDKRLEIPQEIFLTNYKEIKTLLKNFGGKYSKNGFTFSYDAADVLKRIRNKETDNLKKKYQFFATPEKLSDYLCENSFDPMQNRAVNILEPSAGQGSIIDSIFKWFENKAVNIKINEITAIEFMAENFKVLNKKYSTIHPSIELLQMDFLKYDEYINYFDYVIANPPFSKGQDIEHFRKMYEVCKPGGIITSIMSTGWLYNSGKKFKEFRNWLGIKEGVSWGEKIMLKEASKGFADYVGTRISEHGNTETVSIKTFSAGEFKESGTNVITCVLQLTKNDVSDFGYNNEQLTLF